MALAFKGLEPVEFGGKVCTPKIDTETKMRLGEIKKYDAATDRILAMAFPDDEEYVRAFLADKMTTIEKETLHAYLLGGESMVEMIKAEVQNKMSAATVETAEEAGSE